MAADRLLSAAELTEIATEAVPASRSGERGQQSSRPIMGATASPKKKKSYTQGQWCS